MHILGQVELTLLLALFLNGACQSTATVTCNDRVCPADRVCSPSGSSCALPIQIAACEQKAEEEACSIPGLSGTVCLDRLCIAQGCGNGHVEIGEACDDGNTIAGDGCSENCKSTEVCGNGTIDVVGSAVEQCDDGENNSDTRSSACRSDCKLPSCGDGVVDSGLAFGVEYAEECDEGAENVVVSNDMNNGAGANGACRQSVSLQGGLGETLHCVLPLCGDGIVDVNERCDDHNSNNGDGCNPTCSLLGSVTTIAGQSGGPGDRDGVGDSARLQAPHSFTRQDQYIYFTNYHSEKASIVRRIDTISGAIETIAGTASETGVSDGVGATARFRRPHGTAVAGDSLYIADSGNDRIRHVDLLTMEVTTLLGSDSKGAMDGSAAVATLDLPELVAAVNANEIIFMERGPNCLLRHYNLSTDTLTTLSSAGSCVASDANASFGAVIGMVLGNNKMLYVADGNMIRRADLNQSPIVITTLAGTTIGSSADGIGESARFSGPHGLALDGNNLYVADTYNDVIRKIDLSQSPVLVSTVATGIALRYPRALAINDGRLLISGYFDSVVYSGNLEVTPLPLEIVAGAPERTGVVNDDGLDLIRDSLFQQPKGLAIVRESPEQLFVVDDQGREIRSIDLASASPRVSRIARLGVADTIKDLTATSDSLLISAIRLSSARSNIARMDPLTGDILDVYDLDDFNLLGITADQTHAYLAHALGSVVRVDLASGHSQLYAGQPWNSSVRDAYRLDAGFIAPQSIVLCAGSLYLSESSFHVDSHVIRKIDLENEFVSTVAGYATARDHVDGVGADARFDTPMGVACDDRDPLNASLYVADLGASVIRQIELNTGRVSTLAGVPYVAGAAEGIGVEAGFNSPWGLTFDPVSGDLFVTDFVENIVSRIR